MYLVLIYKQEFLTWGTWATKETTESIQEAGEHG